MSEITRAYKREWLFDNGYMKVVDGTEYPGLNISVSRPCTY